jgi:hypothetical protein
MQIQLAWLVSPQPQPSLRYRKVIARIHMFCTTVGNVPSAAVCGPQIDTSQMESSSFINGTAIISRSPSTHGMTVPRKIISDLQRNGRNPELFSYAQLNFGGVERMSGV